jgi:hypothetical protein
MSTNSIQKPTIMRNDHCTAYEEEEEGQKEDEKERFNKEEEEKTHTHTHTHNAIKYLTCKFTQCILQISQRIDIEIIRWLIEKNQISTSFQSFGNL